MTNDTWAHVIASEIAEDEHEGIHHTDDCGKWVGESCTCGASDPEPEEEFEQ